MYLVQNFTITTYVRGINFIYILNSYSKMMINKWIKTYKLKPVRWDTKKKSNLIVYTMSLYVYKVYVITKSDGDAMSSF